MPRSRARLFRSPLPALTLMLASSLTAFGSTPSLTAVRPVGGRRGTEVEATFSGARLGDAQEILFYRPGVTASAITKVDDNTVKAKLTIAADARLGLYDLRLRTASGVSELRSFSVGALPEVNEVEPNNDFAAPQAIAMNTTVNGVAENEDVDHFMVKAKKGDRITAEIEGMRLGITMFDPYVAILNAKRFEMAASDDAALLGQDALASIVAPEDGEYIIQVRESAYAGNGSCLYRLHVGDYPRATGVFPPGGKLGDTLTVRWLGDAAGEATSTVTLPAAPEPDFGLTRADDKGSSPYPNPFRLSTLDNVLEKEPNEAHDTATPFSPPAALNGVLEKAGDVDQYVFAGKKGQTFDFRLFGRQLRSPIDSVMTLAKKGGGQAAANDDSGGPDSYFRFTCPEDAEYVVSVVDQLGGGGPDFVYRVEVDAVAPLLKLSTPAEQIRLGTGAMAPNVPRGNRQALLIQGSRADFSGDVNILAEGLPPGVEIEAPALAASQSVVPVLFKAKADAPLGATLASLSGKPVDPKTAAASEFSSEAALVLGQNNVVVWSRTVDRLAVGVTEESPYSIEIVQPKAPLVRSGQMGLKVRAIRKEGFKAPITLSIPWNPPGVGSSLGVTIPEGQGEAVIPINANGAAELRTWKIVVNGASTGPSGPIMVSSQLADLTIAAPFVGLTFQSATVEQGQETDLAVVVAKNVDFDGEATVTLLGLPNKVTTDVKKITKDSKDLVFHLKTDAASPAGKHTNLFCQVVVTRDGEPVVHNIGSATLRIDAPLPKPAAPAPAAAKPVAAAAPAPAATAKPLSRLEKLRLESKKKQEAAAAEGQ